VRKDRNDVLFLRVRDGTVVEYREHFDPARVQPAFEGIGA
jgi:ketosteroid isomerase-like protein